MRREQRIEYRTQLIIPNDCSIKDIGKTYKFYSSCHSVDLRRVYLPLVADFMKFILKHLLLGYTIYLPYNCGKLSIFGKVVSTEGIEESLSNRLDGKKRFSVDWKATNELNPRGNNATKWKDLPERPLIYEMNHHTNGIRYKIGWDIYKTRMRNSALYKFSFCREAKELLTKTIKQDKKEYFVINPDQNVSNNVMSYDTMSYFNSYL